jgi:ATP-dependent exoDNAse (exonuclease V) beta subunit
MTPQDQAARDRILTQLDTTFVVEAAAGTGKTTVLVGRIVKTVRLGRARLAEIISVTFTEKAAGEMKLRLRDALERERTEAAGAERDRLTQALEELEVARIGTIHELCADLLREYPVEARVDPQFEVAAEADADVLMEAAFEQVFPALLRDPPEGVRRFLRRRVKGWNEESPRQQLLSAVRSLLEHRDFAAPWRRAPFERDAGIDALLPRLTTLAGYLSQVKDAPERSEFLTHLGTVRRFLEDLAHRESVSPRDYDGLEAQLKELLGSQFSWNRFATGVRFKSTTAATVIAERDATYVALRDFVQASEADLAACLHQELMPVVAAYEAEKARLGALDFVDLLLKTRDLVRDCVGVRRSLKERFKRLFVDEFQDTDPLQSELVLLLAADDEAEQRPFSTRPMPGKLFVVGDPKQSIYRFRRADIVLYERVKQHLLTHGAEVAYLTTSFRSTPGIQAAVNGAFELAMRPAPGSHQATYVALDTWRAAVPTQPSVIALPAPRPFGERSVTKDAVEAGLPAAAAAFIDWLIRHSGWTVEEEGARVPVKARHVCILFKRFRGWGGKDIPREYAQALEARQVPHVLVGGRSFHTREEVVALRTALAAVERPDDELSVYATLRGPFFALTDEALLVFKQEVGKFHPLRPLDALTLTPQAQAVGEAMTVLRELHFERNRRTVAETIGELLERTRAHAGLAFWSAGAQALANVLQLQELATREEKRATSFRDVVDALEASADAGEAPEAPIVEEGTDGVRMMTAHAAKGLEFPVVILAEPTAPASRQEPSHWVDPERGVWAHALAGCVPLELREHQAEVLARDAEESVRLAYVAATRARDVLVVPVCSEKRWDTTWLSVLDPVVWPREQTEGTPKLAPGCPEFGEDPIVGRERASMTPVPKPGLHRSRTGKNGVVWWDTSRLDLERESKAGLQAEEALEPEPRAEQAGLQVWERWREDRAQALLEGSTPSERVVVAREVGLDVPPGLIELEDTGVARAHRPRGKRFGELVHAALAVVDLEASPALIASTVAVQARALNSNEAERAAAVEAVTVALQHACFTAARAAKEVRREVALLDFLDDGRVVEGNIDFAYDTGAEWVVVEFKTDVDVTEHRAAYESQTLTYVRAIAAATGRPARGVILRV